MGPKLLLTAPDTTEDEDSEASGEEGSTTMALPFSCTEQMVGEARLLVVLVVVVLLPLVQAVTDAEVAPLLTAAADEAAGTPPAPVPTVMGLVIFM